MQGNVTIESRKAAPVTRGDRSRHSRETWTFKACIFATGLAGIVAEYVLSTLATYLLGNAVLQWTITLSLMLFAMGLGSRVSKYIRHNLLNRFVLIEFVLSLLIAGSALGPYLLSAYITNVAPVIYFNAMLIGFLIGLEIPLVTRLNRDLEELRVNISSVMEHDYYGALLGGLLFAFVALPYLGLTYTPIALGAVNFGVAVMMLARFRKELLRDPTLVFAGLSVPVALVLLFYFAQPIVLYGEQQKYSDRVIYEEQTPYQRIVITQWRDNFWLYLNGNEQFSSYDEALYHEPLVLPAMSIAAAARDVLILGGGDGLAAREVLKYPDVRSVTLVDIDPAMTRLARANEILVGLNRNALNHPKLSIVNQDAAAFLNATQRLFDVVIIDLPDPKSVDLARLYSSQFYKLVRRHLTVGGTVVTQATSPIFSRKAFVSVLKSMRASGLPAVPYHNHVPTLGEWGWVLGWNYKATNELLKARVYQLTPTVPTRFLNHEVMAAMLAFGKGVFDDYADVKVNDEMDLPLFRYYRSGAWDIY